MLCTRCLYLTREDQCNSCIPSVESNRLPRCDRLRLQRGSDIRGFLLASEYTAAGGVCEPTPFGRGPLRLHPWASPPPVSCCRRSLRYQLPLFLFASIGRRTPSHPRHTSRQRHILPRTPHHVFRALVASWFFFVIGHSLGRPLALSGARRLSCSLLSSAIRSGHLTTISGARRLSAFFGIGNLFRTSRAFHRRQVALSLVGFPTLISLPLTHSRAHSPPHPFSPPSALSPFTPLVPPPIHHHIASSRLASRIGSTPFFPDGDSNRHHWHFNRAKLKFDFGSTWHSNRAS